MVFNSIIFLCIFLPIVLLVDKILPHGWKNKWLLLASLFYLGVSQIEYLGLLIAVITISWISALLIEKFNYYNKSKMIFIVAIIIFVVILWYFKYYAFTVSVINLLLKTKYTIPEILLPIGISFYLFQSISYVSDVYLGKVSAQKNIFNVALYEAFFPQFIAGPIVRYDIVDNAIREEKRSIHNLTGGLKRFAIGLGKKVIIADSLNHVVSEIWDRGGWSRQGVLSTPVAWVASIAFTLQIYYDFSGYSDMAIGLGKIFGFEFPENFNYPYISKSLTEFWKRWHISLGSWFRDYIYIPMGGNRKNVYFNLLIVFLLTGIWHGASWNYIVWGVFNGVIIVAERFLRNLNFQLNFGHFGKIGVDTFQHLYLFLTVNIGWIFFRANDIGGALNMLSSMFGINPEQNPRFRISYYLGHWELFIIILAFFFSFGIHRRFSFYKKIKDTMLYDVLVLTMLVCSLIRIVSESYQPFIYFQF